MEQTTSQHLPMYTTQMLRPAGALNHIPSLVSRGQTLDGKVWPRETSFSVYWNEASPTLNFVSAHAQKCW